jgi:predicted NUDIX family NTP pyrophosphohydrolase
MPPRGKLSCGLLIYRKRPRLEVLLVHPGGPFFAKKDLGAWTIPKGEASDGEDLLAAARREVLEETGYEASGPFVELTPVRQKGGKLVHAWACEGDVDPHAIVSNTFALEWPPRSGRRVEFPEIDRADFFDLEMARRKLNAAQVLLLEELERKIATLDV